MSDLDYQPYEGFYSIQDTVVKVAEINGRLTAAFPGVPPGFEAILEPLDATHTFLMNGGPGNGASVVFTMDDGGLGQSINVGGEFDLVRTEPPTEPAVPSGQGLTAPELILDSEKEAAFQAIIDEVLVKRDGRFLNYQLPYPKHEFLQYAAMQETFIFHGSSKSDIDEFRTTRTSMELSDRSGRGNLQAVYGTHDGLWPMFFAIIDRPNLTGSIRNGVNYFTNEAGEEITLYNFSINQDLLDEKPVCDGALYLLSRETFRRLPLVDGAISNEWASEVSIKPLAKLALKPEDFPFLDQIGGHDDSELVRASEVNKQIFAKIIKEIPTEQGLCLQLDWDEELGPLMLEYITFQRKFIPAGKIGLRFDSDGTWLDIDGPPAYLNVMRERLDSK
ncbi:MAG: hypothetical protein GY943_35065 [Chloroflexi bacterium]|nr:hypothetical protein [Chloroflexota bacterium]